MFDWINTHKRAIQLVLLILIVPPFTLWGINYYFQDSGGPGTVASVGGVRVSPQEFENALRERQDQLRQMMQGRVDSALLDSNEVRSAVVNSLVEKKALLGYALRSGVTTTDDQVRKTIVEANEFKDPATGKFSEAIYEQFLKNRRITGQSFEDSVRHDFRLMQVQGSVTATGMYPASVAERLQRIGEQEREVSEVLFTPQQYVSKVTVTDDDIKAYYEANKKEFMVPERAKIEYVVLSLDEVAKGIKIDEAQLREAYDKNAMKYGKPEERRASHILITVAKDAKAEDKAAAKRKAEQILSEVKASPKTFNEAAKKNSQDPGSAANGGDLGFNARGAMVKPFDDAVFSMKTGDIAGPVETEYGYHIIRLDEIRAGESKSFDSVRGEIEQEIRRPLASKAFNEAASKLEESVFNRPDSLEPAAEQLKVKVQKSDWITRQGGGDPVISKPQLLNEVFSDKAIKEKYNTRAIEVAPGTLVSARVVEHKEATALPFEDVKKDIQQRVSVEKAAKLAEQEGKALLERVKKGDDKGVNWSAPVLVSLQKPGQLHAEAARSVFGADPTKFPAYIGAAVSNQRYVVYRVSKAIDPKAVNAEQSKELAKQVSTVVGQQEMQAYVETVKGMAGVEVNPKLFERKEP